MGPDARARATWTRSTPRAPTRLLRPRIAIPIHWGTFRPIGRSERGLTIGDGPAHEFAAHVGELEPESEVRILAPGEETEL